ncbi:MAG: hypothetical protein MJE66_04085 [Proteobacteria bacterium]|nr:hypothetical protein [Pseudomonadota bacterium]
MLPAGKETAVFAATHARARDARARGTTLVMGTLAWIIAGLSLAAVLGLGLRSRALAARLAAVSEALDRVRGERDAAAKQASRNEDERKRRSAETSELRRKLDKVKRRAYQEKTEHADEADRLRDLEAQLEHARGESHRLRLELERVRADAERPQPAAPSPPPVAAPPPPELTARVEELRGRVTQLEGELGGARVEAERWQAKVRTQDKLYLAIRGELAAKKDRLRAQQEELERLRALRVTWASGEAEAAASAPGDPPTP